MSIDNQLNKLTDAYESIELLTSIGERFKNQLTDPELNAIDEAIAALRDDAEELWAEIKRRADWPSLPLPLLGKNVGIKEE